MCNEREGGEGFAELWLPGTECTAEFLVDFSNESH